MENTIDTPGYETPLDLNDPQAIAATIQGMEGGLEPYSEELLKMLAFRLASLISEA